MLEIGFDVYNKTQEKNGQYKLNKVELSTDEERNTFSDGRCPVNEAWGRYFHFKPYSGETDKDDLDVKPVFDKDFDGQVITEKGPLPDWPDYQFKYKYRSFNDWKAPIEEKIKESEEDVKYTKEQLTTRMAQDAKEILELRELQKGCTKEQEFAFDKWEKRINVLKDDQAELQAQLETVYEDDYDYCKAKIVTELLAKREEYRKAGYVVVPYYSF